MSSMFKRRGTKSNFSSKKKETRLPNPKPPIALEEKPINEDTISKRNDVEDKKVEKDNERDPLADKQEGERDQNPKRTTENNEALDNKKTIMKVGDDDVFSLFWEKNLHYYMSPIQITKVARFIPNGMSLQQLLLDSTPIVGRSTWIQKHEKNYCEYAVALGYFYLYYIQIIRAKQAASEVDGFEYSMLKRFMAMHPEESIPIAEPLYPFFCSIVATQLEDRKYDWIVPDYNIDTGIGQARFQDSNNYDHGVEFIRPQIPMMLAILSSFGAETSITLQPKIDDEDTYQPIALLRNAATHCFNMDRRFDRNQAPGATSMILSHCGTSYPFRFHNDNAEQARKYVRRTSFYSPQGIRFAAIAGQNVNGGLAETTATNRIDMFLMMDKDKNARWFDYLKEQMLIFSRHWKSQYNLSQVPKTGGLESSVLCRLKTRNVIQNQLHEYTDHLLDIVDERHIQWYKPYFEEMTGSFKSTRAGVIRKEELQSLTFGINSIPPITTATGNVGHFRSGDFFDHFVDEAIAMELGEWDATQAGPVPMYAGWKSDVVQHIFRAEPQGQRG